MVLPSYRQFLVVACSLLLSSSRIRALHVVIAGGTGLVGAALASRLQDPLETTNARATVTILTRNAFLAATPARVTSDFGWLGESFLQSHPHVKLRDWDGGDLLDIVGKDWIGWQEEVVANADVLVHLTGGGFTEQRVMACERLVRGTYRSGIHHITVNPTNELLSVLSPGVPSMKIDRMERCEEMVKTNCDLYTCLRSNKKLAQEVANEIIEAIRVGPSSN